MMLADHGADVIRIDRGVQPGFSNPARDPLLRSRRSIALDLQTPQGTAAVRRIVGQADGLIEGFRPGVMERLGLGPETLLEDNTRLVYGRMTGWGQDGPMAQAPGHDINYIALSGALHAFGRAGEKPAPPINMVGDFGGGGMLLAFGMLAALLHAQRTGEGQVVDAAMTDGSALLMSMIWGFRAMNRWSDTRGANLLDGGAPFYDTYETQDGKWIAVGAIEPAFYAALRNVLALTDPLWDRQFDPAAWPTMRAELTDRFRTAPRDAWVAAFAGSQACVTPVLSFDEAAAHPHNAQRGTLATVEGVIQPAPAPRYSSSRTVAPAMASARDDAATLADLGFSAQEIAELGL
jgi:alpha-methylacyl-CoA racemase